MHRILLLIVGMFGWGLAPNWLVNAEEAQDSVAAYQLGSGDRVRMMVYGEEDLTGEFEVDGSGNLALPLTGNITAGGLTLRALEQVIVTQYQDGYLINPRVSVEVLNFRPFYILGEVNEPGNYPYISGMTVLNAVAVAKGYTYRAKKSNIEIKRGQGTAEETVTAQESTAVLPGDVIHIKERLF